MTELRTLIKTPKAITRSSYKANEVIYFSNLLDSGVTIDYADIPGDILFHITYFARLRKNKELSAKFEALFKGLMQIAKSFGKRK